MSYNVYKSTNLVNGKIYVGSTTHHIEVRWQQHVSAALNPKCRSPISDFFLDIRRYGREGFILELLETCTSKKAMLGREVHWMKALSSFIPDGYNSPYRRLTDEQVAVVRFNVLCISRSEYAKLFFVSYPVIAIAERGLPKDDPYEYITHEHLPKNIEAFISQFARKNVTASGNVLIRMEEGKL